MNTPKQRILAIHRYYWPDSAPYALLLRSIAERWAAQGHDVRVLSAQPSYKPRFGSTPVSATEVLNGVRVRRIPMKPDRTSRAQRLWNVVRFPLAVTVRVLFGPKTDVVMCSTAPPVLLGALVSLAARLRGARFIYHCMDLHPEIGALSGEFRNRWVFAFLRWVDTRTCHRAVAVVVLSDDMAQALTARDSSLAARIHVVNNFDLPPFGEPPATPETGLLPTDKLRVAFTGNLGRFQGLETVTEAVLGGGDDLEEVELVLMGDGVARPALEGLIGRHPATAHRVHLLPHGPVSAARAVMAEADLGLVSLVPGVISFAYPSKTASYLSEGLPLLLAVEPESSLARTMTDWGVGAVLPLDTVESARTALADWSKRRDVVGGMKSRTRPVWKEHFSAEARLPDWDRLLIDVTEKGRADAY